MPPLFGCILELSLWENPLTFWEETGPVILSPRGRGQGESYGPQHT